MRQDPEDRAAALLLGTIARSCGTLPEAERLFGRALLLAPAYAEAAMALAELRRDAGRYGEALELLDLLLSETSEHVPAHLLKVDLLLQERRLSEADAALVALLGLKPNQPLEIGLHVDSKGFHDVWRPFRCRARCSGCRMKPGWRSSLICRRTNPGRGGSMIAG